MKNKKEKTESFSGKPTVTANEVLKNISRRLLEKSKKKENVMVEDKAFGLMATAELKSLSGYLTH